MTWLADLLRGASPSPTALSGGAPTAAVESAPGLITQGAPPTTKRQPCPRCGTLLDVNVCRQPGCGYGWNFQVQPIERPAETDPARRRELEKQLTAARAVREAQERVLDLRPVELAVRLWLTALAEEAEVTERLTGRSARSVFDEQRARVQERLLPRWPGVERAVTSGHVWDAAGHWRSLF